MKELFLDIPLTKNEDKKRFEINVNGYFAYINYGQAGTQIALVHTDVDSELKGSGAATAVVEKTL